MELFVGLGVFLTLLGASLGFWWWRRTYLALEAQRSQQAVLRLKTEATQHQADYFQQLFTDLLAVAPAAMIVTNQARTIRYFNQEAARLFLAEAGDAIGQPFINVIQDYPTMQLLQEVMQSGTRREKIIQRASTGETWRVTTSPLFLAPAFESADPLGGDPASSLYLVMISDLTAIRHLETVRKEFVANISHELRTPLASIKLLTETVQGCMSNDPAAAIHFLSKIESEVDHLTQLVAELLELSRIESGTVPFHFQEVCLETLLAGGVARLQALAERQQVTIETKVAAGLPTLYLDPERMNQVLINILHNAIKFTPAGGTITVVGGRHDKNTVLISVQDTGIGIPQEDLPRLFERFYKVDRARSKPAGGTGLGLAIARHIVEAHGGDIWAESTVGQGSTFSIALPIERESGRRI